MKLYVIRHGQTDWNKQGKIQGLTDVELNEEGIKQAKVAHEKIKNIELDLVICSPLKRTRKTAEILLEGKNVETIYDDSLIERCFGTLEGATTSDAVKEELQKNYNYYYESTDKTRETLKQLLNRVWCLIDKLKKEHNDKKVLLVTHGGVIRAINAYVEGIPENGQIETKTSAGNCEIIEYEIE